MIKYQTPGEHSAFVDGAHEVIERLLALAATHWKLGRDVIDLDALRDELINARCTASEHVACAQAMEAKLIDQTSTSPKSY